MDAKALRLSEQCHSLISAVRPTAIGSNDLLALLEKVAMVSLPALAVHQAGLKDFSLLVTQSLYQKYFTSTSLVTHGVLCQAAKTLEKQNSFVCWLFARLSSAHVKLASSSSHGSVWVQHYATLLILFVMNHATCRQCSPVHVTEYSRATSSLQSMTTKTRRTTSKAPRTE